MLKSYRLLSGAVALLSLPAFAQQTGITITSPPAPPIVGPLLRPFHLEKRIVSAPRLSNSARIQSLIRGGNLYLTARDVIALVLENNLDIEIQRYGPLLAREVQRRAEGGNLLRDVSSPILSGPVSVSTAGVNLNSSGLASGAEITSGGGVVTGIGPNPPNLDPSIYTNFQAGHLTTPLSNTTLNQTPALTNEYQQFVFQYGQSFLSGTSGYLTVAATRSTENSPSLFLNPSISADIDLYITQNLLQGFGLATNGRDIKVAKNNVKIAELQLRQQVITTVSAALNLYWDLVTFDDTLRVTRQALESAERLYENNKAEAAIGALAPIEVTRAAAAVSAARENLLISQTNVAQQEVVLKNAITRTGTDAVWLDEVHIVPLDRIQIPPQESTAPVADLIREALADRPEIEQERVNLLSRRILLVGDRNGLLPSLSAFVELTNNALAGPVNPLSNGSSLPDPYFIGGAGAIAEQLFRRNFPNYSAGLSLNIPLRNRAAQGDYVTDELQIRQSELQLKRAVNQIGVEVKTSLIGLEQARARYEAAENTRHLSEQNLEAEQNRFKYGAVPDATLVIQAQSDLAANETAELQSMANYTHARIAFDQALGRTLAANHIAMTEAASGHVARESVIPAVVPENATPENATPENAK